MGAADGYVILAGGSALPLEPLRLLLDLERRGFAVWQLGAGLAVEPRDGLTPEDCQLIRRWKHHLLALLDYEPPRRVDGSERRNS